MNAMKQSTRKALGYAVVPLMSVFVLAPTFVEASSDEHFRGKHRGEARHEHTMEHRSMHASSTGERRFNKEDRKGLGSMLGDHGKHRGWYHKNLAAETWLKDIFGSIKDSDYSDFKNAASNTPLGSGTTQETFEKLALASDKIDAGKHEEARSIMKELRDSGYRFKQPLHESLNKLFPKKST
jgi:hypothetical protein